ncbi:hypothetical protein SAMN04489732_11238 [Amycolatopsis saalfeldensis]|uniref:Uncharacterized protein n=1 Tax=Amycolatopsis saalfeldensis TaxID=394193 RepID=A0A1H8YAC5_9PSEU|nr:hypothetical protein SAMN04489732_11238 [Amycolatopsis saalfeldensis]
MIAGKSRVDSALPAAGLDHIHTAGASRAGGAGSAAVLAWQVGHTGVGAKRPRGVPQRVHPVATAFAYRVVWRVRSRSNQVAMERL